MDQLLHKVLLMALILMSSFYTATCSLTLEQKMKNIEQNYVGIIPI